MLRHNMNQKKINPNISSLPLAGVIADSLGVECHTDPYSIPRLNFQNNMTERAEVRRRVCGRMRKPRLPADGHQQNSTCGC